MIHIKNHSGALIITNITKHSNTRDKCSPGGCDLMRGGVATSPRFHFYL